jgi:predicted enzyme related to lactoylglutathione lyase
MTINHLNLVVSDIAEAVNFFEGFFDFTCVAVKGDNVIAILKNDAQFTLVLMTDKDGNDTYPKDFHIGFMHDNITDVDTLHTKLKDGGMDVGEAPRKIRDSYGFYFHFHNLFIEVGHYM